MLAISEEMGDSITAPEVCSELIVVRKVYDY